MPGIVWGDFLGDDPKGVNGAGMEEDDDRAMSKKVGSLNMTGIEFLEDPIGAGESFGIAENECRLNVPDSGGNRFKGLFLYPSASLQHTLLYFLP